MRRHPSALSCATASISPPGDQVSRFGWSGCGEAASCATMMRPPPSTGSHVRTRALSATAMRLTPLARCARTCRRHAYSCFHVKSRFTRSSRTSAGGSCARASARQMDGREQSALAARQVAPSLATSAPSSLDTTSAKICLGRHPSCDSRSASPSFAARSSVLSRPLFSFPITLRNDALMATATPRGAHTGSPT